MIRIVMILLLLGLWPSAALAEDGGGFSHPERVGLGLSFGYSYDPSPPTFDFYQLAGVWQYDYDKIWPHPAPDPLFFKVEWSLGLADFQGQARLITSANIMAQYYLAGGSGRFRPYVEAGIGLIYTDFQIDGQGLRFNFNPQAGLGCDLLTEDGAVWFTNLRAHHISNGGLDDDNRGINSVVVQVGRYF